MTGYLLGVCVRSIGNRHDAAFDGDTISHIAAPEKSYLTPSARCHFHAAYLDAAPGKPASRRVRRAGVRKKVPRQEFRRAFDIEGKDLRHHGCCSIGPWRSGVRPLYRTKICRTCQDITNFSPLSMGGIAGTPVIRAGEGMAADLCRSRRHCPRCVRVCIHAEKALEKSKSGA